MPSGAGFGFVQPEDGDKEIGLDLRYRKIAAALAERGIVTASGGHLNPDSIRPLVRMPSAASKHREGR